MPGKPDRPISMRTVKAKIRRALENNRLRTTGGSSTGGRSVDLRVARADEALNVKSRAELQAMLERDPATQEMAKNLGLETSEYVDRVLGYFNGASDSA